jgi:hypothetical protein
MSLFYYKLNLIAMKFYLLFLTTIVVLYSCKNEQSAETATPPPTPVELPYVLERQDFEIGKSEHLALVLHMLKDWEDGKIDSINKYYADTVTMDVPHGKRVEFFGTEGVEKGLKTVRSWYDKTTNHIVWGASLHDKATNADWVSVQYYNKWTYPDGKRDSIMYFTNWRIANGKIVYAISLEQKPSKQQLNRVETIIQTETSK